MPTAESNGVRLHYELSGDPKGPWLILANSLGSSLRMWDKALPALEERNQILRFDMRGHGQSSIVQEPFTIADLGSDVLVLLNELRVQRASICGLSLGGLVALWLAIHRPERIDQLILANTAPRIGNSLLWKNRIEAVRRDGMSTLAEETVGRWFTPGFRVRHPDEMKTIRTMIAATPPEGYSACCEVLRDTDLSRDTDKVNAPTLVIAGTHDPATPPEDGRALHASLRHSKYIELNASHLSAWESAGDFAQTVIGHLS